MRAEDKCDDINMSVCDLSPLHELSDKFLAGKSASRTVLRDCSHLFKHFRTFIKSDMYDR